MMAVCFECGEDLSHVVGIDGLPLDVCPMCGGLVESFPVEEGPEDGQIES